MSNAALSQKITDATTSLGTLGNNTFTLKADSTDTTAQALNKSGGLVFKVAGDGDLVTTKATTADTIQVSVKKVHYLQIQMVQLIKLQMA